jgi:hypothetical protein
MPSLIFKPAAANQVGAQVLEVRVGGDGTIEMYEPGVPKAPSADPISRLAAASTAILAAGASFTAGAGPVEM